MKRQQINAAAIAVVVEARLGSDRPGEGLQLPGQPLGQLGVAGVAQPRQLRASIASVPAQTEVKRRTDAPEGPDRQRLRVSALEHTDQRCAHIGFPCQIALAPAPAMSERTHDPAQLSIVHG